MVLVVEEYNLVHEIKEVDTIEIEQLHKKLKMVVDLMLWVLNKRK